MKFEVWKTKFSKWRSAWHGLMSGSKFFVIYVSLLISLPSAYLKSTPVGRSSGKIFLRQLSRRKISVILAV